MKDSIKGFGLGYRPPHYKEIFDYPPKVDFFEIITENFLNRSPRPQKFLEKLKSDFSVATHGVGLSIGSLEPLNLEYLKLLKDFAQWLEPKIISDHLCWTSYKGHNSHDLLPTPFTLENLERIAEKVLIVQDVLKSQLVLENPSAYVAFSSNELTESEFLKELSLKTGCGILLDINNVYVNSQNLGLDPYQYFRDLRSTPIKQFHLAGHSVQGSILIDTHDHHVSKDVWSLYALATQYWPEVPTLVEWDDKIPELKTLLKELEIAKKAHHSNITSSVEASHKSVIAHQPQRMDLSGAYNNFFSTITNLKGIAEESFPFLNRATNVPSHQGIRVYNDAYFLRIESVLKELFPTLYYIMEDEGFRETMAHYLSLNPPTHFSISHSGEKLATFLEHNDLGTDFGVSQETLGELAQFEWQLVKTFESRNSKKPLAVGDIQNLKPEEWDKVSFRFIESLELLNFKWDVGHVWEQVQHAQEPEKPVKENCAYIFWNGDGEVRNKKLNLEQITFYNLLAKNSFKDSCADNPEKGLGTLLEFINLGLVSQYFI